MSSFIANSLFRPLAQWYSEINSATLTGAIDVLVIEQEDGTFVSSPFHVRFGKLGVMKAKEKIVDIEINDEPVDIHMKLDDHGTAFFVEECSDSEDESNFPPELATSPLPDQAMEGPPNFSTENSTRESSVNRSLFNEFNNATSVNEEENTNKQKRCDRAKQAVAEMISDKKEHLSSVKSKLNRKKRKRRQKHSRAGSKSSLKDMMLNEENNSSESSEGSKGSKNNNSKNGEKSEEIFDLDDNDNDGDLDDDDNETTPINSQFSSTPVDPSKVPSNACNLPETSSNNNNLVGTPKIETENSFLGSRLPDAPIESILETQKIINEEQKQQNTLQPQSQDYFSEPENSLNPDKRSRSSTILSDSELEFEIQKNMPENQQERPEQEEEQSWEWGQLPTTKTPDHATKDQSDDVKNLTRSMEPEADNRKSWSFSFWKSGQTNKEKKKDKKGGGVYLDDLEDNEEMISIYVGSSRHDHHLGAPHQHHVDDDAESGNGPSLPMSPHSVDGAIGGGRIRYDSSDDENKHLGSHLLPDIAFSLCGGLDTEQGFSTVMFEQSMISFDDFVMKLKNNENVFTNENLVVKIGEQYYNWTSACPIIMSTVLYGRTLPNDLVQVMRDHRDGVMSKESSPNSKVTRSSSWWPFRSVQHNQQPRSSQEREETLVKSVEVASGSANAEVKKIVESSSIMTKIKMEEEVDSKPVEEKKEPEITGESETKRKGNVSESSEGDSDPDLKALSAKNKLFKKSLRLPSDLIKQLNLQPGANEAQFSVTTAYQGTSRCNCHIYRWKSTDKIVISDIDGTITKSDVLGHVLPIIGRDWAQSGVASLFSKIADNGYHIAYLSARAIGQASITKDYLNSIRQGDIKLPDGPLFLNPTSLVNAFHREVIEKKPEKFKIACLRDIQKLFPPDRNPFYAGYGNRVNDVFAYSKVGIPVSRIFTINHKGELRPELSQTFLTTYDCQSSIVDHIFPPYANHSVNPSTHQEFSSFAFWRDPILNFEEETEKEKKEKEKEKSTKP